MQKSLPERVLAILHKRNARHKFKELMALTRSSVKELKVAIAEIRKSHANLVFGKFDRAYYLSDTPTQYSNQTDLSEEMPDEGSIGLISDTHFGSDAERPDLVREAYKEFQRQGITKVFHSGDLCDGENVYKGHSQFIKMKGGSAQAAHFIKNYPKVAGITTYAISGN